MIVKIAKSLSVLCLISFFSQLYAQKNLIAVYDLEAQGIEKTSAVLISDRLRSELLNSGKFTILERGQMQEILKEQGFQQSGCISTECVVEVGQLLGVTHIVTGTIGQLGKTFTLNIRYIDVKTGKILYSVNTDCKCPIDEVLQESTKDVVNQVISRMSPQENLQEDSERVRKEKPQLSPEQRQIRRRKLLPKIGFGILTVTGGAIAAYMNMEAQSKADEMTVLHNQTTANPLLFFDNASKYNDLKEQRDTNLLLRNIFAGLAGAGVIGFGVSFVF